VKAIFFVSIPQTCGLCGWNLKEDADIFSSTQKIAENEIKESFQ
jgi:hypothetical protein